MSANDHTRNAYGGARLTGQRRLIAEVAGALPGAFTIDELAAAVRDADPASGSTATVYRAVSAMEAAGFVKRVGDRGGAVLYARCADSAHHHHIVCDGCGKIAHAACPVGAEAQAAARDAGFVITRHEVTLYGLCPACADAKRQV